MISTIIAVGAATAMIIMAIGWSIVQIVKARTLRNSPPPMDLGSSLERDLIKFRETQFGRRMYTTNLRKKHGVKKGNKG